MPTHQQVSRINDVLYFIHQDISAQLDAKRLCAIAAYSEQHFHRIFKAVVGESVHHYIRRTRLEFAANQLMFDHDATVVEIATKSGFSSVSSFSRAFKSTFNLSPGQWRNIDNHRHETASYYQQLSNAPLPICQIKQLPARNVAYIRHQGYDRSIASAWKALQEWAIINNINDAQQFGLHHSNPALVPIVDCRYVACIGIDKPITRRGLVNSMTIPGGLHAVFQLSGKYGELLPQLSNILVNWLPSSGFKMQSTPTYVHYQQNQFLSSDQRFALTLCLPISLYN